MATITKTIKPLGGGDYTTISSAIVGISYTPGDTIILVCFTGDCGMDDVTQLDANVTVIADPSAKHNGRVSQDIESVAHTTTVVTWEGDSGPRSYTLDGIRVLVDGTNLGLCLDIEQGFVPTISYTVKNCLFAGDTNAQPQIFFLTTDGDSTVNFVNNVVVVTQLFSSSNFLMQFLASPNGPGVARSSIFVAFNSIIVSGGVPDLGMDFETNADSGADLVMNISIQDNFVGGAGTDYQILEFSGGTINIVSGGYNASTDNTATVAGATGAIVGVIPSSQFVDSTSDLRLKTGSSLIHSGVAVLSVTQDNQGSPRSTPPSIGAFEFSTGRSHRRRSSASDFSSIA